MESLKTLSAHICRPEISMREAMERLNALEADHQFQIVCGEDARIAGTVTDGDVRRAILRGVKIDDSVTACMHAKPVTGLIGSPERNSQLLRQMAARPAFLPLIDDTGVLREVLILGGSHRPAMRALVMAGGFGKRLGERTRSTPKPLLPVANKPILDHLLERLERAHISEIYISVHYLAEQIQAFVTERENRVPVEILQEEKPLGTAGAVGLLPEDIGQPCIVLNGDVLTNLDFVALQDFHNRHEFDGTVTVAQHQVQIPFGVIRQTDEGQFSGIEEKPTYTHFVAAGIYLLSHEYRVLIRPGEAMDMPDLIERGRAAGLTTGLFPIHEYWTDVGRPEDLERAAARASD